MKAPDAPNAPQTPGSAIARDQEPALVFVVDFGAQYAQLIARRVREAHVYSEIVSHRATVDEIVARRPAAIILSGGPSSVYEPGAPRLDPRLLAAGIPVLGICYGFQAMAQALGGTVARTELGGVRFDESDSVAERVLLFGRLSEAQTVWMSHGDSVVEMPAGLRATASTAGSPVAAFENSDGSLCGLQWHPEVEHSDHGQAVLERFLYEIAGIEPTWTTSSIIDDTVKAVAAQVGGRHVLCALSGGVDSAVAAALVYRAVGEQLSCVFVDHGFLRAGEQEQVRRDFERATGAHLILIDAKREFLEALDSLEDPTDPEAKRRAIGTTFIRIFENAASSIIAERGIHDEIEFLVQGTLYPDVVESGGGEGAEVIKTHHNVGGLPDDLTFELIEPLRRLFKDEVRAIGIDLGLPEDLVWRQPFPGPGLAIRIIGRVTEDRLAVVRAADAVVRDAFSTAGLDRDIWQCPVVLLADVRSVGVRGDRRSYGHPVVLRPVTSSDAMTADFARLPYDLVARISNRITNEIPEVTRVILDVTSKPPGTIEWE